MITTEYANRQIDYFLTFKDDWNSYGAEPIHKNAAQLARHFAETYPDYLEWVSPFDGGITIEWKRLDRSLEIDCHNDGSFGYLLTVKLVNEEAICEEADSIDFAKFDELYRTHIARAESL